MGRLAGIGPLVLAASIAAFGCVKPQRETTPAPRTSELVSAAHYDTQPPVGEAYLGPAAAVLAMGVGKASERSGTPLTPDARLGALAAWTEAFWAVHGRFPMTSAITYEANRIGLVEPVPSLGLMGTVDDQTVSDRIAEQLEVMLGRGSYTHVGAASVRSGSKLRIVLVLSARPLSLEPLPTQVDAGATLPLSGTLRPGFRAPELLVIAPDGTSSRRKLGGGPGITAEVPMPVRGRYQVELLADGDHGLTVVANFPVFAGARRPPPPNPLPMEHQTAQTPAAMREAMLDLINTTRARQSLPPVASMAALDRIATAHNRDMLGANFVGHTSPTSGKPEDRVRAAGISAPVIAENVGRGYSLKGIHEGLLASPGHRDNLLHPRVTHVGIDVLATEQDEKHEFLVTEVFIRVIPTLQPDDAMRLLGRINRARSDAGQRTLLVDPKLTKLAEAAAHRHVAQPTLAPEANLAQLRQERKPLTLPYSGLSQTLSVVSAIEDIEALEVTRDPAARAIGIGLAQGTRPDAVPNALTAVVLVAY